MKYKVVLHGSRGKMGVSLHEVLTSLGNIDIFSIDRGVAEENLENKVYQSLKALPKQDYDLVIDFTLPDGVLEAVNWCKDKEIPLISGTTGLESQHQKALELLSQKVPVLWASNMSLGIAVMRKLIRQLAPLRDSFDFQLQEFHHNQKVDRPSGTAKTLQEDLNEVLTKSAPEPLSVRGGGIFGIHQLWSMSDEEVVLLEHRALNRMVFAKGAVRAGLWLVKQKKPGLYSIEDTLEQFDNSSVQS